VYEVIRQTDLSVSQSERDLLNLESQAYDVVIIGNVSEDTSGGRPRTSSPS
jgi:hypothetical protein